MGGWEAMRMIMDKVERQRLKQLANDSIIATFGEESPESRLAEALERCVDELDRLDQSPHCSTCSCGLSSNFTLARVEGHLR